MLTRTLFFTVGTTGTLGHWCPWIWAYIGCIHGEVETQNYLPMRLLVWPNISYFFAGVGIMLAGWQSHLCHRTDILVWSPSWWAFTHYDVSQNSVWHCLGQNRSTCTGPLGQKFRTLEMSLDRKTVFCEYWVRLVRTCVPPNEKYFILNPSVLSNYPESARQVV